MRLSKAMMSGAGTCRLEPRDIDSCGFGAALNAVGVPHYEERSERYGDLRRLWPWLADDGGILTNLACSIYSRFDHDVCAGRMSFEELVEYVRSVEPDCDCNRFNCDCTKKTTAVEDGRLQPAQV